MSESKEIPAPVRARRAAKDHSSVSMTAPAKATNVITLTVVIVGAVALVALGYAMGSLMTYLAMR